MKTIGAVLVAIGLLALIYGGVHYQRNRTVLQVGTVEISASENHNVQIPAFAGLGVLIGGAALLVAGSRRGAQS